MRWLYFPRRLEQLFEYETQHARTRHLVAIGLIRSAMTLASAFLFSAPPLTISAGVSATTGCTTPADLIAEADRALYRAKSLGRNRVETATDSDRHGASGRLAATA